MGKRNPLIRAAYAFVIGLVLIVGEWHAWDVWGGPLDETRYCAIEPARDPGGRIARRADVVRAFRKIHPCPATGRTQGACPGWNVDHVIPLAVGGCDAVHNLQWLPVEIKRCAGDKCKDRWERTVYKRAAP